MLELVQPSTAVYCLYLMSPYFVTTLHILIVAVPVHSLPLQQYFRNFFFLVISVLTWLIFEQSHPFP
jgi:hypothetical protein